MMKPKMGFCKGCAQERMLVSGRCASCHQTRFRSYSKSRPKNTGRKYRAKAYKPTGELELFRKIWASRAHVSFVSGALIRSFNIANFAHVLPKGGYGKWRLNEKNIVLLTPEEHSQQHSLAQSDLIALDKRWDNFFNLKQQLREEYNRTKF